MSELPSSEQCICPKDCKGFDWHCKACHPDTPPTSNDVVQRLETWGIDDADSEELYALLADASRELRDTRAGLAACNRVLQQERNAHETSRDDARDAARYRFLRQPGNAIVYAKDRNAWGKGASGHVRYDTAEQLDAAVDAARGAEEPEARRACAGCGLPATAACPHCDTPTCGECANCEHAPENGSEKQT